jgi:alpha-1,3/alpha-1,6-mannosyltransferase
MAAAGKVRAEKEFSLTAMGDRLEDEISTMLTANRRPFHGWQQVFVMLALLGSLFALAVALLLRAL